MMREDPEIIYWWKALGLVSDENDAAENEYEETLKRLVELFLISKPNNWIDGYYGLPEQSFQAFVEALREQIVPFALSWSCLRTSCSREHWRVVPHAWEEGAQVDWEVLVIQSSGLGGPKVPEVRGGSNMKVLRITGPVPMRSLDHFSNLSVLGLNSQELPSQLLASLGALVQLRFLSISTPNLDREELSSSLRCLNNLQHLHLESVSDIDLRFVSGTSRLEVLEMICSGVKDLNSYVQRLAEMKVVKLYMQGILNLEFKRMSLEVLELSTTMLGAVEEFVACVSDGMAPLTFLGLKPVELSRLPRRFNFTGLTYLSLKLAMSKLPSSIVDPEAFPCLRWLKLDGCSMLAELFTLDKLPKLERLELENCNIERLPETPGGGFPRLAYLKLAYCSRLAEVPDLEEVVIIYLTALPSLMQLPGNYPCLEALKLCYMDHFNNHFDDMNKVYQAEPSSSTIWQRKTPSPNRSKVNDILNCLKYM